MNTLQHPKPTTIWNLPSFGRGIHHSLTTCPTTPQYRSLGILEIPRTKYSLSCWFLGAIWISTISGGRQKTPFGSTTTFTLKGENIILFVKTKHLLQAFNPIHIQTRVIVLVY
jgi:hypothetical protein